MEILVQLFVGILGAAATIYAARMQIMRVRMENPEYASPAAVVDPKDFNNPPEKHLENRNVQEIELTLIYPGSRKFRGDRDSDTSTSYSDVSVYLDGTEIGSGDGHTGFSVTCTTNPGIQDFGFHWRKTYRDYVDSFSEREEKRSELTVALEPTPTITIRLSKGFGLRHSEPKESAKELMSTAQAIGMFLGGVVALVVAIAWFLQ